MRLIDADKLLENIQDYTFDTADSAMRRAEHIVKAHICSLIDKQPNAYDVDKVVERLEECIADTTETETGEGASWAYKGAIEIVKGGGVDE